MRRARPRLLAALLAVLLGAAALLSWSQRLPDIEIRTVPWITQHGLVWRAYAPGQGFLAERDGLWRIDVALVLQRHGDTAPPELVLREGGPRGEVLRQARLTAASGGPAGGYASFEFAPLERSAGRMLHFELVPGGDADTSALSPWVRFRGQPSSGRPWGDRVADASALRGEILCEDPDLRAIAFAMEGLDAAAGEVELALWPAEEPAGEALRRVRLAPRAPLAGGWAFFGFEPIAASRWRTFRYELRLPPGAQPVGTVEGLSYWTFHGGGEVDPRLAGMTVGEQALGDRDLVFRAWSRGSVPHLLELALQRMGWRGPVGALLWLLATVAFVALLPPLRPARPAP